MKLTKINDMILNDLQKVGYPEEVITDEVMFDLDKSYKN